MKKIILLILIPIGLLSQENKHKIVFNGNLIFESNGLNKSFLNSMLYGEYITDSMKSQWIEDANHTNSIYSEISNGLSYKYYFNNNIIGLSFSDVNLLNANFSKDLMRLVMEGNFNYQDETLDFNNTSIRADRYQQYKLHYGFKGKKISMHTGLSYLAGNHHLSYIIEKGSLYTAPYGSYLDIEYNINSFITDTSDLSPFKNNGNGLAVDFGIKFNIQEKTVSLDLSNLGFIMWNTSSINVANDSTFIFQGIEVEDIYNFNDSILEANNIIDDINKTNRNSFKSYIPATLHLSLAGKSKYKYLSQYNAGIIAKWQPYMDNTKLSFSKINQGLIESNFSPLFYIHSIIKNKKYDLIPRISYGGYTKDTNIGMALSKGEKNKLTIGTNHLEDLFNGDNAQAFSLYINIKLQF